MSPSGSVSNIQQHTFQAPAFENATVTDAMRLGLIACAPDASLREIARIMATYRVHSVVITEMEGGRPWGIVSDVDLTAAAGKDLDDLTARDIWRTELVTIAADEPLTRAAELLADRGVTHLVVVQPHSGHPVGVVSTLDLAGVLAWGSGSGDLT
jgi:CBS domain-containing protein